MFLSNLTNMASSNRALKRTTCSACFIFSASALILVVYRLPHIQEQRRIFSKQLQAALCKFPRHKNTSFDVYQLNVTASDVISPYRQIPDTRPKECRDVRYDVSTLPTASVIIPFHNEAWSMLVRAIMSVINRTPPNLLQELILVDDASTLPFLREPLDDFVRQFEGGKIRIFRSQRRKGLMQARVSGSKMATGEVLVFLDAHVECNVQWLEPLLSAIKTNSSTVAIPTIDLIDAKTIDYIAWGKNLHGGLKWTLDYTWKPTPYNTHRSPVEPIKTPTTIGCAIAINRKYFIKTGMFDEGMRIWGGENLELSIRTWLCGGALFIYPCSRVGHVFRAFLPYRFPPKYGGTSVIFKNLQRVAEVWMDDYKKFYYGSVKRRYKMTADELASLNERKSLRKRLQCAGFSWYLNHVIPELSVPSEQTAYFGQIRHIFTKQCLYAGPSGNIYAGVCQESKTSTFDLKTNGQLVNYKFSKCCVMSPDRKLIVADCSPSLTATKWTFVLTSPNIVKQSYNGNQTPRGQIVYRDGVKGVYNQKTCLGVDNRTGNVHFMICDPNNQSQFWYFTYRFDYSYAKEQ